MMLSYICEYNRKDNQMKKTFIKSIPALALFLLAASPIFAQNCNPNIPIDGGISALLVAGAGYGIKKLNDKRKAAEK
jgi:hypothetical protein